MFLGGSLAILDLSFSISGWDSFANEYPNQMLYLEMFE